MAEGTKGTVKQAKIAWKDGKAFEAWGGIGHAIRLDADREKNTGLSSMELLLMGLGGCTSLCVLRF